MYNYLIALNIFYQNDLVKTNHISDIKDSFFREKHAYIKVDMVFVSLFW